jgi:hypothetical protein
MKKLVHLFKIFKTVFYFKLFGLGKAVFDQSKFEKF